MQAVFGWILVILVVLAPVRAQAQASDDLVWVQIEAHPTVSEASARAAYWSERLDDVNGFTLRSGWNSIVLGPYTRADAVAVLRDFGGRGLIPRDSYVAFTRSFGAQFWPQGVDLIGTGALAAATTLPTTEPQVTPEPQASDETVAQARASEGRLTRAEREDLQRALRWAGYYNSAIDGSFGRGTRGSMAEWQAANGYEATGVLTSLQRQVLTDAYNAVLAGLEMRPYTDDLAGIELKMPSAALRFDTYDYPFAKFASADATGAELLLISQPGDRARLASLYEILQTLEIMPLDGDRNLRRDTFEMQGQNATRSSYAQASLERGTIKGFVLVWPAGDEARRLRVIDEMRQSFRRLDGALDPSQSLTSTQAIDLVAGLQVRQPERTGSGFFVDRTGKTVTAAQVVAGCTRVTLDGETEALVDIMDSAAGIAVLTPQSALSPADVARFALAPPRLKSDIAVAGYSYGGVLNAATLTYGKVSDLKGLRGEADLIRLEIDALDGDAGGPVLNDSGHVIGMLLPRASGTRDLPPEVRFALTPDALRATTGAIDPTPQTVGLEDGPKAPQDIADHARDVTVLVGCWN